MKRVVIPCVLALSLLVTLPADARRKVQWWVGNEKPFWKLVHDSYEKLHKDIDIVILTGEVDKFYTMITAGLMPDVWGPWGTPGINADVNRNWALDLTPYLKRDGKAMDIADFFPGAMNQFRINGRQFSMPAYMNIDYFFYNTALWAEAGLQPPPLDSKDKSWDWDKMLANAMKTTKRDGAGKLQQSGIALTMDWQTVPPWVHMWGAQPYSKETFRTSVPQKIHLETPEMTNALTKAWELRWKHNVYGNAFLGGKTAASMENGYVIYDIVTQKKLKWAIRNLPWAVNNSGTLYPNGWRISRVSKHKEDAWEFVRYLCSESSLNSAGNDPKSFMQYTAPMRRTVFNSTLGANISKATGMAVADVYRVAAQADDVGIVKYTDSVCLHADMDKYLDPELQAVWENKVSPKAGLARMQEIADKRLPELFKRWVRNIRFTGADRNYAPANTGGKGGVI